LPRSSAVRFIVVQALAVACFTASGNAQDHHFGPVRRNVIVAGLNGALGGLTAGTSQAFAGKSFWRGFARGAAGGLVVYGGKCLIAERSPAAWWAGRELAAIGSSEVANAANGRPAFQIVTIPVGLIRFHFEPRAKRVLSPTLDVVSTAYAIAISTRSGSRLAIGQSLATGAIVFVTRETSNAIGGNAAGIVTLSELVPNGNFPALQSERDVISHELIHSAQYDFLVTAWADPIQSVIVRKLPWTKPVTRYLDFNLLMPLEVVANSLVLYGSRPWEKEARSLVSHDR